VGDRGHALAGYPGERNEPDDPRGEGRAFDAGFLSSAALSLSHLWEIRRRK